MGGNTVLAGLYIIIPGLIALFVTWGAWRHVLRAFAVWFVLLLTVFFVITGGNIGHTAYGVLIYGMFFTVFAVPILSLIIKYWIRFRKKPMTIHS